MKLIHFLFQIYPVRVSKNHSAENTIVLLLAHVDDDEDAHYVYLPNPEKVLAPSTIRSDRSGEKSKKRKVFFCFNCFNYVYRKSSYDEHVAWCHKEAGQHKQFPKKGEVLSFDPKNKCSKVAYTIFYDFETRQAEPESQCSCPPEAVELAKKLKEQNTSVEDSELAQGELPPLPKKRKTIEKITSQMLENDAIDGFFDEQERAADNDNMRRKVITNRKRTADSVTKKVKKVKVCPHKTFTLKEQLPISYSLIMVDRTGNVVEDHFYVGDDAAENFIEKLLDLEKKYLGKMPCAKMKMTKKASLMIANATCCHICKQELRNDSVIDHDHLTGEIIGLAHNSCNLHRVEPKKIVTFAHNFSGYDSHLIVRHLGKFNSRIRELKAIPLNTEKFKSIQINNIHMLDSAAFLSDSLERLVKTLTVSSHTFPILRQWMKKDEDIRLLTRKGVYPYAFASSIEKLKNSTTLPTSDEFFNELNDDHITAEDYAHAQHVFDHFKCSNMLDYTKLYNISDVYLLAEVVFDFRNWVFNQFELDICHYMSLPMLAKDVMLKTTAVEIGMIHDPEMVHALQTNIRGGLSFIGTRYGNTKDVAKDMVMLYLDANNLYGKAMTFPMPKNNFRWMSEKEIKEFDVQKDVTDKNGTGYILEVTMRYPKHLHQAHNSFPLAPVAKTITNTDLSPYSKECLRLISGKEKKNYSATKLTATFEDRVKYLCHGLNLQFYLEQGLELVEIHRGIAFYQEDFIRPYVEMCSTMRAESKTKSESDRCKLMSNSLYGKVKIFF